jgi:HTH-type transcriptional regulator/antitoxin HigA
MSTTFTPAEVFPAGDYLRDELEERGWTVSEFAEIIGRPIQAVSEILNGKKEITTETAFAFADALGTTPELWLNLQTNFRLYEARSASERGLSPVARRARLRGLIPLSKAKARGWLPDTEDLDQLEAAACELLELSNLDEQPSFALAARRSNSNESISPEQTAWLAHVRRVGVSRQCDPTCDLAALGHLAADLPKRTSRDASALRRVPEWFAECGVIVVFSEGLPGGKLDGAVTFLADGRPVIGVTTRGDRFDSVLFTLLHEAAHLTLGHISTGAQSIIDIDVAEEQTEPIEREANDQATAWLFPQGFQFEAASIPAVARGAERYGVHPSVIVGQIHRHTGNWSWQRAKIPKVRGELIAAGLMS